MNSGLKARATANTRGTDMVRDKSIMGCAIEMSEQQAHNMDTVPEHPFASGLEEHVQTHGFQHPHRTIKFP